MSKRKSIVSSFGGFATQPPRADIESVAKIGTGKTTTRVGAGIVGATKRSLTELREERDQLLAAVQDGDTILSIDPSLIDPSPFRDRLPDDDDREFELFKGTLKSEGQKVPITIRPHPVSPNRYQTVYGHRRSRALKELGVKAEAILRNYSDQELAVAQGIENASRQDLSWIEKALFVATTETAGLKSKHIKAALSIDDAQLSKFRAVYKTFGEDVIRAIGRAPKIGRPRWVALAALINGESDLKALSRTLSADKVLQMSSDERFLIAHASMLNSKEHKGPSPSRITRTLDDVGEITFGKRDIKISVNENYSAHFNEFMEKEIGDLISKFKSSLENET